jgi:hemerythrin
MFAWQKGLNVGVPEIDAQHRRLFQLAANLQSAMLARKPRSLLDPVLSNLIVYTSGHFANEEELMLRHSYPDYAAHKAEHDRLVAKALALQHDADIGNDRPGLEVLDLLKEWLERHVRGADKTMGAFLADRIGA